MAELLKDGYNRPLLEKLAGLISRQDSNFKAKNFLAQVFDETWDSLELKQRMSHIAKIMGRTIVHPYEQQLKILYPVAEGANTGFLGMVFPDFVEQFGLEEWNLSIPALEWFTRFASSEFAVRPFIIKDQPQMMKQMLEWSKNVNYHVRRLASEGCRPRLPWAMALPALKKDPTPILPILENLKDDSEEYVRRSVANNLNDISKDNPELVIQISREWLGKNEKTDWIVKHACRSLLKIGNTDVLTLFGFENPDKVKIRNPKLKKEKIRIGAELEFQFDLETTATSLGKIRLEYAIDYVKKNGKLSTKVFQISESEIAAKTKSYIRKQSFKDMTTRKHNPGKHHLKIIVNGVEKWQTPFDVV
ncbi:MAG: DNA alkylation repair protein [Proteobacteria bacterium]|nr:DNA alkylation repair protein [Pseudomonadota bacterium]